MSSFLEIYADESHFQMELKNALKKLEWAVKQKTDYRDMELTNTSSDTSSDNGSQDSKESTSSRKCTLLLPRGNTQSVSNKCLQYVTDLLGYFPPGTTSLNLGWVALKQIWNISENDIDSSVLQVLQNYPETQQEHILLSFAVIDLTSIVNLSAYLNCLIKEHGENRQVCIYYIAGYCDGGCPYMHPDTSGWKLLKERWGLTYRDIDYSDLDHLSKLPRRQIDSILTDLANMNLGSVQNISIYIPYLIHKLETSGTDSTKRDTMIKPPAPAARITMLDRSTPSRVPYSTSEIGLCPLNPSANPWHPKKF